MADTEDYLQVETILDSCIIDVGYFSHSYHQGGGNCLKNYLLAWIPIWQNYLPQNGKRWYNIKWKAVWLPHNKLPVEALKDFHSSNKDKEDKKYSILEEKVDLNSEKKYLLCSINTWEPEEKLARLYPLLLCSYWTANTNTEEIVQINPDGNVSSLADIRRTIMLQRGTIINYVPNGFNQSQTPEFKQLLPKISMNDEESMKMNAIESGEKPFKCGECSKEFLRSNSLKMHMRTHTGEKPYECKECGKHFSQRGTLTVHMRSHTGEKPFKCWYCERQFSCQHYLKCHISTHTGEKAYECDYCGKKFSQKGTLTVHIRTHTGEKPYKCVVCAKDFSSQQYLKLHMTTHSDEKPFHCEVCFKNFVRSDSLKLHMRTHNDAKPFQCKVCDKQFKSNHYLKLHKATHSSVKAFACDECGREFSQKTSLMRHRKIHQKTTDVNGNYAVHVNLK